MKTSELSSNGSILYGKPNFRDIGGLPAFKGRKIKTGLVFRSGDLHSLTVEEIIILEDLGLATIIDFRSPREREHHPDKKIRTVKETRNLDILDLSREQAAVYLQNNNAKGLETLLVGDYIRMVRANQKEFSQMLEILANTDNLPVVFHCAAGKDRTGLAAFFLLTALGVDHKLVLQDFYASNIHNAAYSERIIQKINEMGLKGELMRPMLEVRPEYLDPALEVIDNEFGGLKGYITECLEADITRLRERFLE